MATSTLRRRILSKMSGCRGMFIDSQGNMSYLYNQPGFPRIEQVSTEDGGVDLKFVYPDNSQWTDEMREEFEEAARANLQQHLSRLT